MYGNPYDYDQSTNSYRNNYYDHISAGYNKEEDTMKMSLKNFKDSYNAGGLAWMKEEEVREASNISVVEITYEVQRFDQVAVRDENGMLLYWKDGDMHIENMTKYCLYKAKSPQKWYLDLKHDDCDAEYYVMCKGDVLDPANHHIDRWHKVISIKVL